MGLEEKINEARDAFEKDAATLTVEQLKTKVLGREGVVRDLFTLLKTVPPAEKGAAGEKKAAAPEKDKK